MRLSRRAVLQGTAAGLVAFPGRQARAVELARPEGTTLDGTVVRGARGTGGYAVLAHGPSEPHRVREDLGARARAGREARRTSLLAFGQLTDIHVVDAQSPARVEYLDRYNDGPGSSLIFGAAYRPHEMLTTQVADRIVAAVEAVGVGPVAGRELDFVICTGDNSDNCQSNELRWQIDVLDGGQVRPDSGSTLAWQGVHDQEPLSYDTHYWHPDGTPEGKADDELRATYGFPVVKGLLDAARRPFTAHGLKRRWYTCYGNHDGLVQGNFPATLQLSTVSTGPVKVVSLPAGVSPADVASGAVDPTALLNAPVRVVTADADRRILTRTETVKEHFTTGGVPLGHGYTSANLSSGTAYYAFGAAPGVLGIVLDTVNPNGEADGSIDQPQLAWLTSRLAALTTGVAIVFSHHTIGSMTNPLVSVDSPGPRVLGPAVRDLLLQHPRVVAWVNGHTHVNRVTAHPRAGGGGFWEVNTASHVDWPAQARLLELVDNHDGTLSLFGTVVDAAVPLSYGGSLRDTTGLAALARELAANDPQERSDARRGKVEDRNVELLLRSPLASGTGVRPVVAPPSSGDGGDGSLPTTGLGTGVAVTGLAALAAARLLRRGEQA